MISGIYQNKGFSELKPSVYYKVTPVPKPRMTQGSKYRPTPQIERYYAFKDECRLLGVKIPKQGYRVTFILPMPKSWSKKKKIEMMHKPHQQTPDKDNLEKALLDAVYDQDCEVYDGWARKIWGAEGGILIEDIVSIYNISISQYVQCNVAKIATC